jgi:hypothetical protein
LTIRPLLNHWSRNRRSRLADVAELIELIARQRPRSNNLIDDALT